MAHDSSCFSLWAMRLYEFTLLNPKGDGFLLWIFWSSSSLNLLVQAFPSLGPILTPLSPVSCESYFVPDKYHVCAVHSDYLWSPFLLIPHLSTQLTVCPVPIGACSTQQLSVRR
ncbi:hypothetical protein J008_06835 [Cryptococcus neoformans]|nr:hypothetical protein C362_06809 [Cryptococcus neoformans var. grubii Bt1]OXC65260.1 hypothetical protein AYX13_05631 [Cryptococcus neoformans var. grubii]OXH21371.1 hypothetical protein J008_06835 [Cryptococcus neoformans var. grubii]